MTITALGNSVLFTFVDDINSRNEFVKGSTESGIIIAGDTFDSSAKQSRWVNVIAIGPDVKDIQVGDQALLPALRWTEGIKHEGLRFWKTDEKEVVAVRRSGKLFPLASWVLFKRHVNGHVRQVGLIAVIGGVTETPSGTAFAVGPAADAELVGTTIYYNDPNFTDFIKHEGVEIAFIKDENILAFSQE